jgi:hypothetical protein
MQKYNREEAAYVSEVVKKDIRDRETTEGKRLMIYT